jgi:DnaJ-class molecular chaperone
MPFDIAFKDKDRIPVENESIITKTVEIIGEVEHEKHDYSYSNFVNNHLCLFCDGEGYDDDAREICPACGGYGRNIGEC